MNTNTVESFLFMPCLAEVWADFVNKFNNIEM